MMNRDNQYYAGLINELLKSSKECEWVEFKHNSTDKDDIGEYLSALANSAALHGKVNGYLIWGIEDETQKILGTNFEPKKKKVGNEELENWLLQRLNPRIHFQFHTVETAGKPVVLLEVPAACQHPVVFNNEKFIRVGSYKKKLKDFPEKEGELWRILDKKPFESLIALEKVDGPKVLELLDHQSYFELLQHPLPDGHKAILEMLEVDKMIESCSAGGFNITNLGAILFAKKLDSFPKLKRKAVRVIRYKGTGRIETTKEQIGSKGYAAGFEGLIDFITAMLPSNELVGRALREDVPMFPELAIRELVANALIHQDFFETGTGPMIELFDDRLEITNPGVSLVDTKRFLDSPPKSRNESLASFMRRIGVCEERGSGIDKVVFQTEFYQLPAPLFETPNSFTKATLFAHLDFNAMDMTDRVRACYLHCCLQYVNRKKMNNSSLRERFRLPPEKAMTISRIISKTSEAGLIVNQNTSESRRHTCYVPFWSQSDAN